MKSCLRLHNLRWYNLSRLTLEKTVVSSPCFYFNASYTDCSYLTFDCVPNGVRQKAVETLQCFIVENRHESLSRGFRREASGQ